MRAARLGSARVEAVLYSNFARCSRVPKNACPNSEAKAEPPTEQSKVVSKRGGPDLLSRPRLKANRTSPLIYIMTAYGQSVALKIVAHIRNEPINLMKYEVTLSPQISTEHHVMHCETSGRLWGLTINA
jgi:hypothetical protein